MPFIPRVIIRDEKAGQWLSFSGLRQSFCLSRVSDIIPALERIEKAVCDEGLWAAGWISYEASPAFDGAYVTHASGEFPMMWMALFGTCEPVDLNLALRVEKNNSMRDVNWLPSISLPDYHQKIAQIKNQLSEGNSYQVNYTFRQAADLPITAEQAFSEFATNARYGAFIETEHFSLCSASPELFFEKNGSRICCRPMKGTAPRGRYLEEDLALKDELAQSEKNRAENLMITDMIRNDLGKIADIGSVEVTRPFAIEKYPTVWQMTSTVSADCHANLVGIFSALFPCASITGAPKANTMKIIRQLEPEPRKIYTGTIGFIRPDMSMQFNVAIRTLLLDKSTNRAEYGVGGGIVWDSDAESEYQECMIKTRVLAGTSDDSHSLLETLLWTPAEGYFLLDYHLRRLKQSALYFDYHFDENQVNASLAKIIAQAKMPQRVRLTMDKVGSVQATCQDFVTRDPAQPYRLILSDKPVDEQNIYYYHKTTERRCYDYFARLYPDYDDVLLQNSRGEITESLIANLIIESAGKFYTPSRQCGLLAGTYRQHLLDTGYMTEKIISIDDLEKADKIYLANSVRKIWPVQLEFVRF